MKTMSRLSAAERRQQNVGSRASAAARGHGRACRRCDYGNGNVILAKMGGLENVLPYIRLI